MDPKEAWSILVETGAVLTDGHFVLASGRHAGEYVLKDAVFVRTGKISALCRAIAELFVDAGVEVVVGPVVGGAIISQWVAHYLSELTGREVLSVYADKAGNRTFVIKRGYEELIPGKIVLVVDDVATTGGSVVGVIDEVRRLKGNVIGLGLLCNRGGVMPEDVGNPPKLLALVNVSLESWPEEECPLCAKGVPINTKVGRGADFLAKKAGQGA